jgi:hypothetical protein
MRSSRSSCSLSALVSTAALHLLGLVGLGPLLPATTHAQVALPITQLDEGAVRVDGMLRDWNGAHMSSLGEGTDASMRYVLGYDSRGLYIACEVTDERLIRNREPGDGDDAVIVTLAMPSGRGFTATELWLHAGESGRSAAAATSGAPGARRRGAIRGATVVEAPRTGGAGYTLEAFVPFAAIQGAARWQEGRGSIRLHDVDSLSHPEAESEPAFAPVDRAHLDRLPPLRPSGGQSAVLDRFLHEHELDGTAPRFDLRGDVAGDAQAERVVLVDRFVVAFGPTIQGGRGFVFVQLGIDVAADLRDARLEDLTGDGKSELVVTIRQRGGGGSRDLFQLLRIDEQAIAPLWALETRKEVGTGSVESTVRVQRGRRGQAPTITVRVGEARGLDAGTLREAPPTDVEPMLLPWGPALERSYRWDGRTFARTGERPNPRYVDPATAEAQARAARERDAATQAQAQAPVAPTTDAVLTEFRRQRGLPASARPARDLSANVAATPASERVVLYGLDLVVVGAEFRNGTGWFQYQLPAASAADIIDLRTADVTGDGRHEIVVRIRQTLRGADGGDIRREVLLVHQFTPTGFPAILQREVAREQGRNRIENEVRLEGGALEIRPGTSRGWDQASWPYAPATGPGADGIEPLILPWTGQSARYRFAGGRLSAS